LPAAYGKRRQIDSGQAIDYVLYPVGMPDGMTPSLMMHLSLFRVFTDFAQLKSGGSIYAAVAA
jgi:hypothetical protein